MWGHTADISLDPSTVWVPITVLAASLAGSAHCVGMCGGLVTSICRTRWQWLGYQFGRLISYASLGAGAGYVGHALLTGRTERWAAWGATILMALSFFAMGLRAWKGRSPHVSVIPSEVVNWFYRKAYGVPFLLGALSAVLPCGWLQSFVLAAAATQSARGGFGLMVFFWLGTLPALSAAPWITQRLLRPLASRAPKLTAILLILAGLAGLGFKIRPLFAAGRDIHCHCEHDMGDDMESPH